MVENPLFEGLELIREAPPFVIYIFGVTGDLTDKKLMPALFSLFIKGNITRFRIVGFARRDWTDEFFRDRAANMIQGVAGASDEQRTAFLSRLSYLQSTFEEEAGYKKMDEYTHDIKNRVYYLSTPPSNYETIITMLGEHGRVESREGFTRIVVEKPFGRDLESAGRLNQLLAKYFREPEIFRIDHYLGKETVQNIMLLRFGNSILEPIWNSKYVDHIEITVAESIGVGTRANYYERSGAVRDMVQNHLLQLLSLTMMEPPSNLSADAIRGEKVKVVGALRPVSSDDVDRRTVRAQYGPGFVDGDPVPGYKDEEGIAENSTTETYVALCLYVDTWRWSGVPVFVRSGKRLARKVSEIAVQFTDVPHMLFPLSQPGRNRNTLIIRIQPNEGATLIMNSKIPGHTISMRPVNMDFSYGDSFGEEAPDAYERLLLDAIVGDSTLYTRRDEIEASWRFITGVHDSWRQAGSPVHDYMPGSVGPDASTAMITSYGRRWRRI